MVAQYLDLTDEIKTNGFAQFEASNYDYAVIQIDGNDGDVYFKSTLDSGAIQGVTEGNISTSVNYVSIGGIRLSDNTYTTVATDNENGLFRFNVVGRYIRIEAGEGNVLSKLLVMLTKIG